MAGDRVTASEQGAVWLALQRNGWWVSLLAAVVAIGAIFFDSTSHMVSQWSREEYSHGYLIPFIAAWIAWQRWSGIDSPSIVGSWVGVPLVVLGLVIAVMGEIGTIYTVVQYAILVTLFGLVLALIGWRGVRCLWLPLIYLAFMIPLPSFLYNNLSSEMQLISSQIGVEIVRLLGISVFLEGNVIDLGTYQLQVAEACSGLRYLFPLMSFGCLVAYLYRGPIWHKVLLFLSTGPITILMNSFRIGVTGVMVDHFGIEAAEGFLHYFEGWIIFLAAVVILFLLMWLLARLGGVKAKPWDLMEFAVPHRSNIPASRTTFAVSKAYFVALTVLLTFGAMSMALPERKEAEPERRTFALFPLQLAEWWGYERGLSDILVNALKVDDYFTAEYSRITDLSTVELYVAYYGSQRKGASVHSPRSCIPAGGWEIVDLTQRMVGRIHGGRDPLQVNRVIVAKGRSKLLVYYWFDQRGRRLTNEYRVKWFIFWDAVTRNRTDGALVRVTTPISDSEDPRQADERLSDFIRSAYPALRDHVPS